MKPLSDPRLNRLLAGRDRLTQADKDAVLDDVFARLPAGERPRPRIAAWLRWGFAAAAVLLVGSSVFLLARPSAPVVTARGTGASPAFALYCAQTMTEGRCATGGKLLFKLDPQGARWFAALARSEGGSVVWYFTAADLGALARDGLLEQAVPLGPEHAPGRYEVWGVFSQAPLDKAGLRALIERGADATGRSSVARRPLEVSP